MSETDENKADSTALDVDVDVEANAEGQDSAIELNIDTVYPDNVSVSNHGSPRGRAKSLRMSYNSLDGKEKEVKEMPPVENLEDYLTYNTEKVEAESIIDAVYTENANTEHLILGYCTYISQLAMLIGLYVTNLSQKKAEMDLATKYFFNIFLYPLITSKITNFSVESWPRSFKNSIVTEIFLSRAGWLDARSVVDCCFFYQKVIFYLVIIGKFFWKLGCIITIGPFFTYQVGAKVYSKRESLTMLLELILQIFAVLVTFKITVTQKTLLDVLVNFAGLTIVLEFDEAVAQLVKPRFSKNTVEIKEDADLDDQQLKTINDQLQKSERDWIITISMLYFVPIIIGFWSTNVVTVDGFEADDWETYYRDTNP